MSLKTLRFGPLPSTTDKEGRTPPRSAWARYIDIPSGTRLLVVALPGQQIVVDAFVTRSFSKDLDPGKYRYVMKKDINGPEDGSPGTCMRVEGEFLIDVTEAQWKRLSGMVPRAARASQTSDGPTWVCKMPGCAEKTQTRLAAFLHEARVHFGIDPLAEPEKLVDLQAASIGAVDDLKRTARAAAGGSDADVLKAMRDAAADT